MPVAARPRVPARRDRSRSDSAAMPSRRRSAWTNTFLARSSPSPSRVATAPHTSPSTATRKARIPPVAHFRRSNSTHSSGRLTCPSAATSDPAWSLALASHPSSSTISRSDTSSRARAPAGGSAPSTRNPVSTRRRYPAPARARSRSSSGRSRYTRDIPHPSPRNRRVTDATHPPASPPPITDGRTRWTTHPAGVASIPGIHATSAPSISATVAPSSKYRRSLSNRAAAKDSGVISGRETRSPRTSCPRPGRSPAGRSGAARTAGKVPLHGAGELGLLGPAEGPGADDPRLDLAHPVLDQLQLADGLQMAPHRGRNTGHMRGRRAGSTCSAPGRRCG